MGINQQRTTGNHQRKSIVRVGQEQITVMVSGNNRNGIGNQHHQQMRNRGNNQRWLQWATSRVNNSNNNQQPQQRNVSGVTQRGVTNWGNAIKSTTVNHAAR